MNLVTSAFGAPASKISLWYHRHLHLVNNLCLVAFLAALFVALASLVALPIIFLHHGGFPVLIPFTALALAVLVVLVCGTLGPHTQDVIFHQDPAFLTHATNAAPNIIASKLSPAFTRPYPTFGEPGAFGDFDEYLRAQLTNAVATVATEPRAERLDKLFLYLAQLVKDRYPQLEILVRVRLPDSWELPSNWQADAHAPGWFFERGNSWLKIGQHDQPIFETSYHAFAQDPSILRFSVSSASTPGPQPYSS